VCFSPNGARVASASWDNTVGVSDPIKGTLHLTLRGHTDWVNACAFSPDGSRIATASHDQTVILWDSTTGARIHTFTHHANWVVALAFSPDSKYLASASYDATVVLTHVERRTTRSFRPHTKRVSALAFTADGAHLLSASYDGCITAHRVADVLSVTDPAPSGRFFTKAPATALCSSASLSAAGDSLGNVYQLNFEL
jgi:WD40 repeat protein